MKVILLLMITSCQFHSSQKVILNGTLSEIERGKILVATYACASCHTIKGVSDNPGMIGPPLTNWKSRKYIAGKLPNNKRNLVHWIMHPQEINKHSAMPDLGVLEDEAKDVAAYLYSQ